MLTAFQCEVVAYLGEGELYCPDCAPHIDLGGGAYLDHALIRYTVDEEFPGGAWCGNCEEEIVEPAEGYCTEHDAWDEGDGKGRCSLAAFYGYDDGADCRFPKPSQDYCTAHDSWRAYTDSDRPTCEYVLQTRGAQDYRCQFPGDQECTAHGEARVEGEEFCQGSFAADNAGFNGTARRIAAEMTIEQQGQVDDDPCSFPGVA